MLKSAVEAAIIFKVYEDGKERAAGQTEPALLPFKGVGGS